MAAPSDIFVNLFNEVAHSFANEPEVDIQSDPVTFSPPQFKYVVGALAFPYARAKAKTFKSRGQLRSFMPMILHSGTLYSHQGL